MTTHNSSSPVSPPGEPVTGNRAPTAARSVHLTPTGLIRPDELLDDDLLFVRSSGGIQRFIDLAGDWARHVALVAHIDQFPFVIEFGRGGPRLRPLWKVLRVYDEILVGRVKRCGDYQPRCLVTLALREAHNEAYYPGNRDLAAAGANSLLRNLRPLWAERARARLFTSATRRAAGQVQHDLAMCSTFIARVLAASCEHHRVAFDPMSSKHDSGRTLVASGARFQGTAMFVMPDDLWRADIYETRLAIAVGAGESIARPKRA
jgi:hypothetical protein